jgi:hypothetical protein
MTVGEKRQRLIETTDAPYFAFVDDDDDLHDRYGEWMLGGIRAGADVVGFKLRHFVNGVLTGYATHSLASGAWRKEEHDDGLSRYWRTPNHLNPIRRELALSIGYKAMTCGEDADYSRRLFAAHGSTMRELFVDEFVYDYLFVEKVPMPVVTYDAFGRLTRAGAEKAIREGGSAAWAGRMCTTIEQLDA